MRPDWQILTDEEKAQLSPNARLNIDIVEAMRRGDDELADRLRQDLIIPAEALLALKRARGADVITEWNLKTETAEEKYGKDWLIKEI